MASSACIRVASITVAVIIARFLTPLPVAVFAMSGPEDRGEITPQLTQRALVAGIDGDLDAHAGAQRKVVQVLIEGQAMRCTTLTKFPVAFCGGNSARIPNRTRERSSLSWTT